MIARVVLIYLCFTVSGLQLMAQNGGSLTGLLDLTGQYYFEDEDINAQVPRGVIGLNSYALLNYTNGGFSAGLRYESYLDPLLGYPVEFDGSGVGYRYIGWQKEGLQVTAGNFYEQFGSGILLRTFEERFLGLDNAFDGVRIAYEPVEGINLKGLVGKQRFRFDDGLINSDGVVRGFDAEVDLNRLVGSIQVDSSELYMRWGGSFVSKFNDDNPTSTYDLPQNVAGFGSRIDLGYKDFRAYAEYTRKQNDPYPTSGDFYDPFHYSYKDGEALLLNFGYSTKGFALDLSARHMDNMLWRSTNQSVSPTALFIGFIPAITKQHTYNLASTLYPYATNLFGEVAFNADLIYKFKRNSALGGKYGMKVTLGFATAYAPKREFLDDAEGDRQGYTTRLFAMTDSILVRDANITLEKKLSKKVKGKLMYMNLTFEDRALLVAVKHELIDAHIAIADFTFKIDKKHAIRIETQGLWTEQDQGDWAFAQVEFTASPHWSFTILDQYNYGNSEPDRRFHYALGNVTYAKGPHRFSMQYGRQRAGFFCVGGVCRFVPASNGFTLGITSSF
ncbi:MAG: hypothetical protein HKN79_00790 [Flavobacteriales bacterium]|nr:hypothetical protein [Flavobacteriales bacterium]